MKLLKLIPDNTNLDFMRWRNVALMISIIATIGSLALVAVRGLNLGVDFVGGQVVRTTFSQPINVEQLRSRVNALNIGEASIQEFGGPRSYQIRLPSLVGRSGEPCRHRGSRHDHQLLSRRPGGRGRVRVRQGQRGAGA
jgi:preprotein translocase subunit SecF